MRSRLTFLVVLVAAGVGCATIASPTTTNPPIWVEGCKRTAFFDGKNRFFAGAHCLTSQQLVGIAEPGMRDTIVYNRAVNETRIVVDRYFATLMHRYAKTDPGEVPFGVYLKSLATAVAADRGFEASVDNWHEAEDTTVCRRVLLDLEGNLLQRLGNADLDPFTIEFIRANAFRIFEVVSTELEAECEPLLPQG